MRPAKASVLLGHGGRSAGVTFRRSITRRTVLWVVPHRAAVARKLPSSLYARGCPTVPSLTSQWVSLGADVDGVNTVMVIPRGTSRWLAQFEGGDFCTGRVPVNVATRTLSRGV